MFAHLGFPDHLGSALIAHFALGDGPEVWSWAAATGVLWAVSYVFWRRSRPRRAPDPRRGVRSPHTTRSRARYSRVRQLMTLRPCTTITVPR
jgi:hypothetical protein